MKSLRYNQIPTRYVWADLIRVLAIIGVVCIHAFIIPPIIFDNISIQNISLWVIFITAKTAIPLFILLSGALLLNHQESELRFWQKRVIRILFPWFFWSILYGVFKYNILGSNIILALPTLKEILSAEFSFIPALIMLYALVPFFNIFIANSPIQLRWRLILFWFFGLSILPYWRNTMAFPAIVDNGVVRVALHYSGYFLLGYELRNLLKKTSSKNIVNGILGLLGLLGGVAATLAMQLNYRSELPLFLSYVAPGIVFASASSFILLYQLGEWWQHTSIPHSQIQLKMLQRLSMASFGVFFIHPLLLKPFHTVFQLAATSSLLTQIATMVSITFVSFLLILTMQEVKWLKKLVS